MPKLSDVQRARDTTARVKQSRTRHTLRTFRPTKMTQQTPIFPPDISHVNTVIHGLQSINKTKNKRFR